MTKRVILLDSEHLGRNLEEDLPGRPAVRMLVSPYDIPDSLLAGYEAENGSLVIEFRYISTEPDTVNVVVDNVKLRLGRKTRRLYGLELNLRRELKDQGANAEQRAALRNVVPNIIRKAIQSLEAGAAKAALSNYRVAETALSEARNQISELVTA